MEVTDRLIDEQEPRHGLGLTSGCSLSGDSPESRSSSGQSPASDCQEQSCSCRASPNGLSSDTRLYDHLLETVTQIFEISELRRLVPPKRTGRLITDSPEPGTGQSERDPIAFTETIAYEFLAQGGKQARPLMALATYLAFENVELERKGVCTAEVVEAVARQIPDHVKRVAVSVESFHKASLIHDDIEDQDEYRYGRPTLHRRYGIASAINVGDYLIGLGYRLVSRDTQISGPEVAAELIDILADAHQRLCEGQGAELYWRDTLNKKLRAEDALEIYALKTSPAFEAALMCGARLRGPTSRYVDSFRRFARHIGIAFQILNDLKDWEVDEGNKNSSGGDLLAGRPTVLWALALEKLPPKERECLLELPGDFRKTPAARTSLARVFYRQADVFSSARELIFFHRAAAAAVAQEFPEGALRRLLEYFIEVVINRPHGLESLPSR